MQVVHVLLLQFLFFFCSSVWASDQNQLVLVRLDKNLDKITFVAAGARLNGKLVSNEMLSRFTIFRENNIWVVRNTADNVLLKQLNSSELSIEALRIDTAFKKLPLSIKLVADQNKFHLIGRVALHQYLMGVIAHEMPTSWPLETLKAQTIAARSYALSVMQERKNKSWHLEGSTDDQVFGHIESQENKYAAARQAINQTDGIVLINTNDKTKKKVLKAFYHADCGGETISAKKVWGVNIDMGTAKDTECARNPKNKWTLTLSQSEILKKLSLLDEFKNSLPSPLQLLTYKSEVSFRIEQLKLQFGDKQKKFSSADFRMLLGPDKMKSTQFRVEQDSGQFYFSGVGFGHGVGLCQQGSKILGLRGRTHAQILAHYYPRALLR
jgi:stage II sporulation protein D